jgi:hypothetical protein
MTLGENSDRPLIPRIAPLKKIALNVGFAKRAIEVGD